MSKAPLLSLPQSPSPSTPDLTQFHDPSPLSATPVPTSNAQSVPSASTSGPIDFIPPALPSPSRLHKRRPPVVPLTPDEEAAATRVSSRVAARLTVDHISVLFPDVETPFQDVEDVVDRLLPYHVFQHPREDLLKTGGKGKRKATETEILQSELEETKFALECFKRRRALEERFRRARTKSGKRTASDDQAYYLERQLLDAERAEHSALSTEYRNAKSELERVTRLQRVAALPQRTNYYPSAAPVYAHHYRTYHYPYAQTYGAPGGSAPAIQGYPYSVPLSSTITQYVPPALATSIPTTKSPSAATTLASGSTSTPTTTSPLTPASDTSVPTPTISAAGMSTAIPVQLPVSSLPTLHALGIVPVPPQSSSSNAPTPPAVMRGTSANGAMLNLEINVSLLQAAQMSGLALVLNSIMRGSSNTATGEVPPHAQVGAPYTYPYTTMQPPAPTTVVTPSSSAEPNKAATQLQGQEGKT